MPKRKKPPAAPEAIPSEAVVFLPHEWNQRPSVETALEKSHYLAAALDSFPDMIELWRRTGDDQGDLHALRERVLAVGLLASGILGDLELCGSPLALGWQSGEPLAPIATLDAPSPGELSIAAKACLRAMGLTFASKESGRGHETGVQEIDLDAIDCESLRHASTLLRDGIARLANYGEANDLAPDADSLLSADHSDDFRSVQWYGQSYSFTENQAAVVSILWDNWKRGTPDVGGATLMEAAEISGNRLDSAFRGCPAWRRMIRPGDTKGTYRLVAPETLS